MDNTTDTPPSATADAPIVFTRIAENIGLAFDTETTGLPLWKEPSEHPDQPHIVQLAAKLVDLDTREVLKSMDVLIKPEGWSWDDSAASEDLAFQTHRITMERAMTEGIPEVEAVLQFLAMVAELAPQEEVIGHNESFDHRMVRIAIKRYLDPGTPEGQELPSDKWKAVNTFCTMWKSKPICRLPGNKLPKLTEVFLHFTGKPMEGAHNANSDVDGCLAVYFALKELERPALKAA